MFLLHVLVLFTVVVVFVVVGCGDHSCDMIVIVIFIVIAVFS